MSWGLSTASHLGKSGYTQLYLSSRYTVNRKLYIANSALLGYTTNLPPIMQLTAQFRLLVTWFNFLIKTAYTGSTRSNGLLWYVRGVGSYTFFFVKLCYLNVLGGRITFSNRCIVGFRDQGAILTPAISRFVKYCSNGYPQRNLLFF